MPYWAALVIVLLLAGFALAYLKIDPFVRKLIIAVLVAIVIVFFFGVVFGFDFPSMPTPHVHWSD